MPAAAQRKHEIKHKLSCSGNSDVCINLPHWDSVAPARATQVNFGSATPQLVHQQERTQVSAAEEDEEEIHQRQWNHTENGTTQAMCCEDKARASSGCLSITHKPWLPRNGSDCSLRACPLQQVWAHIIHRAKCEVTVSHQTFVLFYRQNTSKVCPSLKKQAHQTLGSDTSIWHLEVDVQENSQSCLSCL